MRRASSGAHSSAAGSELSDVGSADTFSRRVGISLKDLDGDEREEDDVATTAQAIELAIFGVLYTLSKEKVDGSKWIGVLKMVLDFLQQLVVLLSPSYGWFPWVSEWTSRLTWLWDGLSYLNFAAKITGSSYGVYEGFLYATAALLFCSLLLCAYVGWCFKRHKFAYVWPVWTLRVVVSMCYQTFYVSAIGIFLVSINCHWLAPEGSTYKRGYLDKYPDYKCLDMPYIVNLVLSVVLLITFSGIVFVTTAADFELSPLADGLLAAMHPRVELINLAAKTVFMLASAILVVDVPRVQAVVFAGAMGAQAFATLRWMPALRGWVNHMRAGFALCLTWVSVMLLVLTTTKSAQDPMGDTAKTLTTITLAGIPGFIFGGVVLGFARLSFFSRRALGAFRRAPPDAKLKDIYKFIDVYEVEVVARVCRTPGPESGTYDDESVRLAERVLRAGTAAYPNSAFSHILLSNFLIEVQTLYQAGQSQLMAAKKLSPGPVEKFAVFVREQQHMQRAHTQTTGEAAVDLVSYVEFQRNFRLLARATKRALTAQQAFWRLLLHSRVRFSALTSAFNSIEAAQQNATRTYRMVLDRYPNSVKLLRSYARFQEEVMNNPWRAAKVHEKADRLEEQQAAAQDTILFSADNRAMLTQVDDKRNAVCVIDANGVIQMTNKMLQKLFGYKSSELEGQSVSILMPAPFSTRHQGYVAAYLSTGHAKIIDSVRQVVALHRSRYMFPIRLAVTRLSGQGQDSTFMGVIGLVESDASSVSVWCMVNGATLTVDQRFQDLFGVAPAEVIGRTFKDFVVEQDELQRLMDNALQFSEEELNGSGGLRAPGLHVSHKFAGPVQVDVTLRRGGTADEPLHLLSLTPVSMTAPPLVVFNRIGSIVFASSSLCQLLGYTTRSIGLLSAEALMPPHYQLLHAGGIRDLMQRKSAHTCRSGATVLMASSNKALVPVRLSMTHKAEGEENLLTVTEVQRSSLEAGLDERRLKVEVSPSGEVVSIVSTSTSAALFGVLPEALLGLSVFRLFPDLAEAGAGAEEQEEVVEALRLMSMERLAPVYMRVRMGSMNLDLHSPQDRASPGPLLGSGLDLWRLRSRQHQAHSSRYSAGGMAPKEGPEAGHAASSEAPGAGSSRPVSGREVPPVAYAAPTSADPGSAAALLDPAQPTPMNPDTGLTGESAHGVSVTAAHGPVENGDAPPSAEGGAGGGAPEIEPSTSASQPQCQPESQPQALDGPNLPAAASRGGSGGAGSCIVLGVASSGPSGHPHVHANTPGSGTGIGIPGSGMRAVSRGPSGSAAMRAGTGCVDLIRDETGMPPQTPHAGSGSAAPEDRPSDRRTLTPPQHLALGLATQAGDTSVAALSPCGSGRTPAGRQLSGDPFSPTAGGGAGGQPAGGGGPGSLAATPSGVFRPMGSGTPSHFNAVAAAALARARLQAARSNKLQRQGGLHFGLPPRPVILEIDGTSGEANLVVSIWHPDKVASVLEVSRDGDIRQALLDEMHPPGPVFGLSATALMQFHLRDVLCIPPTATVSDFLFGIDRSKSRALKEPLAPARSAAAGSGTGGGGGVSHAGAVRPGRHGGLTHSTHGTHGSHAAGGAGAGAGGGGGVLKSIVSQRNRRAPGPPLHLTVLHADGQPLKIAVQALPKKTSASTLFVRIHLLSKTNAETATSAAAFNAVLGRLCGPGTLQRMAPPPPLLPSPPPNTSPADRTPTSHVAISEPGAAAGPVPAATRDDAGADGPSGPTPSRQQLRPASVPVRSASAVAGGRGVSLTTLESAAAPAVLEGTGGGTGRSGLPELFRAEQRRSIAAAAATGRSYEVLGGTRGSGGSVVLPLGRPAAVAARGPVEGEPEPERVSAHRSTRHSSVGGHVSTASLYDWRYDNGKQPRTSLQRQRGALEQGEGQGRLGSEQAAAAAMLERQSEAPALPRNQSSSQLQKSRSGSRSRPRSQGHHRSSLPTSRSKDLEPGVPQQTNGLSGRRAATGTGVGRSAQGTEPRDGTPATTHAPKGRDSRRWSLSFRNDLYEQRPGGAKGTPAPAHGDGGRAGAADASVAVLHTAAGAGGSGELLSPPDLSPSPTRHPSRRASSSRHRSSTATGAAVGAGPRQGSRRRSLPDPPPQLGPHPTAGGGEGAAEFSGAEEEDDDRASDDISESRTLFTDDYGDEDDPLFRERMAALASLGPAPGDDDPEGPADTPRDTPTPGLGLGLGLGPGGANGLGLGLRSTPSWPARLQGGGGPGPDGRAPLPGVGVSPEDSGRQGSGADGAIEEGDEAEDEDEVSDEDHSENVRTPTGSASRAPRRVGLGGGESGGRTRSAASGLPGTGHMASALLRIPSAELAEAPSPLGWMHPAPGGGGGGTSGRGRTQARTRPRTQSPGNPGGAAGSGSPLGLADAVQRMLTDQSGASPHTPKMLAGPGGRGAYGSGGLPLSAVRSPGSLGDLSRLSGGREQTGGSAALRRALTRDWVAGGGGSNDPTPTKLVHIFTPGIAAGTPPGSFTYPTLLPPPPTASNRAHSVGPSQAHSQALSGPIAFMDDGASVKGGGLGPSGSVVHARAGVPGIGSGGLPYGLPARDGQVDAYGNALLGGSHPYPNCYPTQMPSGLIPSGYESADATQVQLMLQSDAYAAAGVAAGPGAGMGMGMGVGMGGAALLPPGGSPGLGDGGSEVASSYLGHEATERDPERQADFQRGRRLRRITKVLERPKARHATDAFARDSLLVAALLTLSHLGCAVGILVLLSQLASCVDHMCDTGLALDGLHRAALDSRVLELLSRSVSQPPLYTPADSAAWASALGAEADDFEARHMAGYRRSGGLEGGLHGLWEAPRWAVQRLVDAGGAGPPVLSSETMSMFDMGKVFTDAARDLQSNHPYYAAQGRPLAGTPAFRFIHDQAVWQLTAAYTEVLDEQVGQCLDQASLVNRVLLALLVVEACCICGSACVYLSYRLMQVTRYRCSLFSVFLAIPSATIKTQATRQLDEQGDEADSVDASDDGARTSAAANKARAAANAALNRRTGGGGGGTNLLERFSAAHAAAAATGRPSHAGAHAQHPATAYPPNRHTVTIAGPHYPADSAAASTGAGGSGGHGYGYGYGGGHGGSPSAAPGQKVTTFAGLQSDQSPGRRWWPGEESVHGLRSGAGVSPGNGQGPYHSHGQVSGLGPSLLGRPPVAPEAESPLASGTPRSVRRGGSRGRVAPRPAAPRAGNRAGTVTDEGSYSGEDDDESWRGGDDGGGEYGEDGTAVEAGAYDRTKAAMAAAGRAVASGARWLAAVTRRGVKAAGRMRELAAHRAVLVFRRKSRMGNNKVLVAHSLQNWYLVLPIIIWAVLIISLYAVSYVLIGQVSQPLETLSAANFCVWRTSRLTYFAHELCALPPNRTAEQLAAYRAHLYARRVTASMEWEVLLYGSTRYNETFIRQANLTVAPHRVGESGGVAHSSGRMSDLLFRTGRCLRANAGACFAPGHPFYAATHQGVSTVMRALFAAVDALLAAPSQDVSLNNTHHQFTFLVGPNDARDGMLAVREVDREQLMSQIDDVMAIHISLLVTSFVLMFVFVFYLVRPFVRYTREEAKHMAKLLSQLGQDVEVEKLVEAALGVAAPAASLGATPTPAAAPSGLALAGAGVGSPASGQRVGLGW